MTCWRGTWDYTCRLMLAVEVQQLVRVHVNLTAPVPRHTLREALSLCCRLQVVNVGSEMPLDRFESCQIVREFTSTRPLNTEISPLNHTADDQVAAVAGY